MRCDEFKEQRDAFYGDHADPTLPLCFGCEVAVPLPWEQVKKYLLKWCRNQLAYLLKPRQGPPYRWHRTGVRMSHMTPDDLLSKLFQTKECVVCGRGMCYSNNVWRKPPRLKLYSYQRPISDENVFFVCICCVANKNNDEVRKHIRVKSKELWAYPNPADDPNPDWLEGVTPCPADVEPTKRQ